MSRFTPSFEHLSDDELARELHCWEHCALVSFRTQRQVARMHVRHLNDEVRRREVVRAFAGGPIQAAPESDRTSEVHHS